MAPGANPAVIRMAVEGARTLRLDAQGRLIMRNDAGEMVQEVPVIYQGDGESRHLIQGHYVLLGSGEIGFAIGSYDHRKPLVIDPTLNYATYLGGPSATNDRGFAIATWTNLGHSYAYVTGVTFSPGFPITGTYLAYQNVCKPTFLCWDAFVDDLDLTASSLVYGTFLGGSNLEQGDGIAVDGSGNAYVTGQTRSSDFPTLHPVQASGGTTTDAFVSAFNSTGGLLFSTYLGGGGTDIGTGVAVHGSGVYVTGYTNSTGGSPFPTTAGAYQTANKGGYDAFATELTWNGSTLSYGYSTLIGGSGDDNGNAIAVDSSGYAYITGWTVSADFPTANAVQSVYSGGQHDAFVARVKTDGSGLTYSTYLDGAGDDQGNGIAVDNASPQPNAYVAGSTTSTDFPWAPASLPYQKRNNGNSDVFVTKLAWSGSALTYAYSTYVGGGGSDTGQGIAVDSSGDAYVTGWTSSADFPLQSPLSGQGQYQTSNNTWPSGNEAFVFKLNAAGTALTYSTYLGGTPGGPSSGKGDDRGYGIAVDGSGAAYVAGWTSSTNFPATAGAYQTSNGDSTGATYDAFIAKIS